MDETAPAQQELIQLARQMVNPPEEKTLQKAIQLAKEYGTVQHIPLSRALELGKIMLRQGMDDSSILAAIISPALENQLPENIPQTPMGERIQKELGPEVMTILQAHLTLQQAIQKSSLTYSSTDLMTKILLASTKDLRGLILFLGQVLETYKSNRIHESANPENIAKQTLNIFAPLAHKIGAYALKSELEDEAFRVLNKPGYERIQAQISQQTQEKEKEIQAVVQKITKGMETAKIPVKVSWRTKNIYAIYEKMKRKNLNASQILDVNGLRIITKNAKECYRALTIIHSLFPPVPGEFDDYIARPKPNLYQSLHTTVLDPNGNPLEIQIRTEEMHQIAEHGAAGHWKYKGKTQSIETKIQWFKQLLAWREEMELKNFGSNANLLGQDKIFALTPKGLIIELPSRSTPVDFAYAVHSGLGNECRGARINGKEEELGTPLKTGDVVEIITRKGQKPMRDWLSFIKTERARSRIIQYLDLLKEEIPRRTGLHIKNETVESDHPATILVREDDSKIRLAGCCNPIPGDEIVGILSSTRRYIIHLKGCPGTYHTPRIEAQWNQDKSNNQLLTIAVLCTDKNLLAQLLAEFQNQRAEVIKASVKANETNIRLIIRAKIENKDHFEQIKNQLLKNPHVLRVNRINN
ncbi:MAG: bifunctional (p)ppGpp synthetase/guanosine-3',5'-bis(diphosphate) 3'-pyrophosphohydrolase [Candidatus Diapherotrites archaeon]|nr:bifunctional (p)ppGpp synthetase/guanosine-3',5'-bis(diphosphate) 3'-pyrophosphohydrolase [Candidatus Diapherotrites archaeon]